MIATEKLTRERFRELYADRKPNYELIDGVPEQKALGSKRHSYLTLILAQMLEELGFRAAPELTVEVSETWEPVPDVARRRKAPRAAGRKARRRMPRR